MEQVPHIAMYCQEVPDHLVQVVPLHLLPLVVKFLTDKNNQVIAYWYICLGSSLFPSRKVDFLIFCTIFV